MHRRVIVALGRLVQGIGNRTRRARLAIARRRRRRRTPVVPWTLGVEGPAWFGRLLSGTVAIVAPRDAQTVVEVVPPAAPATDVQLAVRGRSETIAVAPFVDDGRANPLRRPRIHALPPPYASLAVTAGRPPRPPRRPLRGDALRVWLDATRRAHPAYREAHRRTSRDVVAEIAAAAGQELPVPTDASVTVVCATNRMAEVPRIAANFARQLHEPRRLVLVLNVDHIDERALESVLAPLAHVDVLQRSSDWSLGRCLNDGLRLAESRYVAKFDDDDEYGPHYLGDMLLTHRYADAAVVGKHSYVAYLESADETVLRAPGREFEYTSHVAGGTLVIDRERTDGIWFPDVSLGEDQAFIRACERAGLSVCASDRFNYVQRRHGSNTWAVDDVRYRRGSISLGRGCRLDESFV